MANNQKKLLVDEIQCGENISYVLKKASIFSSTEFKVLISYTNEGFIDVCKMQWNGRIQLFYFTNEYVPLSRMIDSLNSDEIVGLLISILSSIILVKNNGFLSYQNIDVSLDKVFVDPKNNQARLVYLPLNQKLFPNAMEFNKALVNEISRMTNAQSLVEGIQSVYLNNESFSLEELLSFIKQNTSATVVSKDNHYRKPSCLKLIAVNAPFPLELLVEKDNYLIGRNESVVDGFVSFSKMIGRQHCKIRIMNGEFYVTDLDSANGTYLNHSKERLSAYQLYKLSNGDMLRLAKSVFKVEILS